MECIRDFFIHNFKLESSSNFDESIFNSGVSIYEVIRIERGIPLFLENHLSRLYQSADISNLKINEGYCDFESLIEQLIKKNTISQGKIKLILQYNPEKSSHEKDMYIYFTPHYFPSKKEINEGVSVGICNAIRINPNAKVLNTKARNKANHTIAENKIFEVLLKNNSGFISEGSRSNIFYIKNQIVFTAPERDVLNGITRQNIIKLCNDHNIKLIEKKISKSEITEMNSAFLSGTSLKVLPIKNIEETILDTTHSTLLKIMNFYDSLVDDYIEEKLS
jgi:branched-chain amino acid aminotransferase